MVANTAMLTKPDVIAYVGANAYKFNLDPAAVLAVADQEGLKTQPGSVWQLPKEPYKSFGPPSWYGGGAGNAILLAHGNDPVAASQWSWTPAGLDYWLQKVQEAGAGGLTGAAAIRQIIGGYGWGFERPAAENAAKEFTNASNAYRGFQQLINNGPGSGNTIVPTPDQPGVVTIPGQTGPGQLPIPSNPQDKAKPQATTGAKFSLHLFDTPAGPVDFTLPWDFSGILLFLAAIFALIIGALLWKPSRDAATNVVVAGAMA
jgi:hypothetical protein